MENSSEFKEIRSDLLSVEAGEGRTAQTQALFQLAALCTTLGIALVGGAVTGNHFIIKYDSSSIIGA